MYRLEQNKDECVENISWNIITPEGNKLVTVYDKSDAENIIKSLNLATDSVLNTLAD